MISKRAEIYSEALFSLQSEAVLLESLKVFSAVISEPPTSEFFNSSIIPVEDKKQILQEILKSGSSSKELKNFLFILLDKKAISLLPEITENYQKLFDEKNLIATGTIYSSQILSPEEKTRVEKSIEKFLNKKVDLQEKQDKSLIAGLYVKVAGYVIDDTIGSHLNKFKTFKGGL